MLTLKKKGLLVLLCLLTFKLMGQATFTGYVTDNSKSPLENAYVYNITAEKHTHSNGQGFFSLKNVSLGDTIQVGLLGFLATKIVVQKEDLNGPKTIQLLTDRITLDELLIQTEEDVLSSLLLVDLRANPVNSSQEILRRVPGLFIGQHAGGGKAEQIFLRGFDIDHGTDFSIQVDGMPVNMVSHAHGQGYSDLHFLIPETIQKIDFGKGPYHSQKGDFTTAGYVDFSTKESIEQNQVSLEIGDFNTQRLVTLINWLDHSSTSNFYSAFEQVLSDGPFESEQNFTRTNLFSKFSKRFENFDKLIITSSYFASEWTASGQIPQRAVDDGTISRFGAIDDTEGGNTSRFNLSTQYTALLNDNSTLRTNAYYSYYDFELYSNFTFFLEDPLNGDQIRQKEKRSILGLNSLWTSKSNYKNSEIKYKIGTGFRKDMIRDNELSKTRNRSETLERVQLGDIDQLNAYTFVDTDMEFGNFELNLAARLDYFNFNYENQLSGQNNSQNELIINPKVNLGYQFSSDFKLYLKSGIGFHSNDARLVTQNATDFLARAYGADLGAIWKPSAKVIFNTAFWYLFSEEELVYVGDAGIVEPSGRSRRYGVDLGMRFQLAEWLYLDSNLTYTYARSVDEMDGNDFIPLAPDYTITGGLSMIDFHGFSAGIHMRYLDNRPANEDNSIIATGYFITDINVNYKWKKFELGLRIENLFDADWNETQFETTSRLQTEITPVTEIHFTPGTPFFAKGRIAYNF